MLNCLETFPSKCPLFPHWLRTMFVFCDNDITPECRRRPTWEKKLLGHIFWAWKTPFMLQVREATPHSAGKQGYWALVSFTFHNRDLFSYLSIILISGSLLLFPRVNHLTGEIMLFLDWSCSNWTRNSTNSKKLSYLVNPAGSRLQAHISWQVFLLRGVGKVALNHQNGLYITFDNVHRHYTPLTGEVGDRSNLKGIWGAKENWFCWSNIYIVL